MDESLNFHIFIFHLKERKRDIYWGKLELWHRLYFSWFYLLRTRVHCFSALPYQPQQQIIKYESLKIFNQIKCRVSCGFVFSRARSLMSLMEMRTEAGKKTLPFTHRIINNRKPRLPFFSRKEFLLNCLRTTNAIYSDFLDSFPS